MLVPFIISVILIIAIIIFIFKVRVKYRDDIERATLKYSAGN